MLVVDLGLHPQAAGPARALQPGHLFKPSPETLNLTVHRGLSGSDHGVQLPGNRYVAAFAKLAPKWANLACNAKLLLDQGVAMTAYRSGQMLRAGLADKKLPESETLLGLDSREGKI